MKVISQFTTVVPLDSIAFQDGLCREKAAVIIDSHFLTLLVREIDSERPLPPDEEASRQFGKFARKTKTKITMSKLN